MTNWFKNGIETSKKNGAVRCVRRIDNHPTPTGIMEIKDNRLWLDFRNIPSKISSFEPKVAGVGAISDERVATVSATVFARLLVANKDCEGTMDWATAVGYSNPYSGSYPADVEVGTSAGELKNVDPNNCYMNNATPNQLSGCNAYYEKEDKSDQGSWRLPNKRELAYMIISSDRVEDKLPGFTPMIGKYWSASERYSGVYNGHYVTNLEITGNEIKTATHLVRCVKEDHSILKFRVTYDPNGGFNAPASTRYNVSSTVTILPTIPTHPDKYTFLYWTYNNGKETIILNAGNTFIMPNHNVTLIANWNKNE